MATVPNVFPTSNPKKGFTVAEKKNAKRLSGLN
jgi:hypothetical protein